MERTGRKEGGHTRSRLDRSAAAREISSRYVSDKDIWSYLAEEVEPFEAIARLENVTGMFLHRLAWFRLHSAFLALAALVLLQLFLV